MAGEKNFNVKNGLSVGGVEVINSSGDIVAGGVGSAVQEAIADKIGGIIQGSGSTTVTYDDAADTITISSTGKTTEEIQDIVGGMVSSNTESGITVAYEDGDGTIDFTVGTLNQNTTGSAATLTTPRAIGGTSFDGSADIAVALSATATALASARTIHGVSFDGTSNIDLSEVVQDTVGAMFSSNTETGITVGYEDGDGTIDLVVGTLNQDTTGSAATLTTPRTIQGVSFDGSANITTMTAGTGVGVSGTAVSIGQAVATSDSPTFAGLTLTGNSTHTGHILPSADNTYDLGSSSKMWKDVYIGPGSLYVNGQKVVEDDSGTITISADDNQNVSVKTGGSGDVELDPTGTGKIELKGPVNVTAGSNISSSDGNAIAFSNSIDVDAIESRSTNTNLTLTANGSGVVAVNDSLTISGDLTVSGTTTTVNSETISLADNIIVLNSNFTSGTPSEDTGFSVLRGGSATKTFMWDESEDYWSVGSETMVAATFVGNLTGNVTGNVSGSAGTATGNAGSATILANARTIGGVSFDGSANINLPGVNTAGTQTSVGLTGTPNISVGTIGSGAITITNATNAGGTARNIYQSTSAPGGSDGAVGDLWVLYS